ncbi:MAG TPA: sigma 54-interacting transcriptional regulator [Planctomycetaceae bacterium]|nr:sigma 54-interacting transcriptional regulator [Planctomycetaceae bacterium]
MTTHPNNDWPTCTAEIVGASRAADVLRRDIADAGGDDGPVLIVGEPGSGVSLAARTIHQGSQRRRRPFVWLDAQLHTADSLEHELLGTGSQSDSAEEGHESRLRQAAGGTICLENLDSFPQAIRSRLGRMLGGAAAGRPPHPAGTAGSMNVRVLGTSHGGAGPDASRPFGAGRELRAASAASRGGPGLEALLAGICGGASVRVIVVPPLRMRREDIGLLAEHVLHQLATLAGRRPKQLTIDALRRLEGYAWPQNVRELGSVLHRACALDEGPRLTGEMIGPWLADGAVSQAGDPPGLPLKDMERQLIEATFARCHGNRERTAQSLGIGIRTLSGKLREYGYPPRGGPGSNRPAARSGFAA